MRSWGFKMSLSISVQEIVEKNERNLLSKKDNWSRIPVSEVAEILNGFAFKSGLFTTDNNKGMPLIRIRDIKNSESKTYFNGDYPKEYVIKKGDILIGMDGDFDIAIWNGEDALLNQRVCKITVNENKFNKKFLYYLMPGYLQAIHNATSAVTVKHLSSRDIARIPLPNPSLEEQQQVVDEIEKQLTRLDASVKDLKSVRNKIKLYKDSILKFAYEGKLTDSIIEWKSIEDFIDMSSGVAFKKSEYSDSGVRLFQIANVTFGKTTWEEVAYLPEDYLVKYPHLSLKKGDILMALNRPLLNHILKIAILESKDVPSILYQRVGRFEFIKPINKKYFFYYMRSPFLLQDLEKTLQGVNIPFINKSKLMKFRFPICSTENQERIVNEIETRFSIIDKLEQTIDSSLLKTEQLRKSILKSAFEGNLVKEVVA